MGLEALVAGLDKREILAPQLTAAARQECSTASHVYKVKLGVTRDRNRSKHISWDCYSVMFIARLDNEVGPWQ